LRSQARGRPRLGERRADRAGSGSCVHENCRDAALQEGELEVWSLRGAGDCGRQLVVARRMRVVRRWLVSRLAVVVVVVAVRVVRVHVPMSVSCVRLALAVRLAREVERCVDVVDTEECGDPEQAQNQFHRRRRS